MGKLVREQYGASGYNARRLARDQTSKIAGQLNKVRQTGVGIEQYKWRTSQDNRVRPSHAAHEVSYSTGKTRRQGPAILELM